MQNINKIILTGANLRFQAPVGFNLLRWVAYLLNMYDLLKPTDFIYFISISRDRNIR